MEKGFPGGSVVKNLPAMQETQVQSLGQKEPQEKEMATMERGAWWATVHGVAKESDRTQQLNNKLNTV